MKPPKKTSLVPVTGEWSRSLGARKLSIGAIQHSFKGGTYDLYGDQLLENEDAIAYIYEKAKQGATIRVWTQGDSPVEAMVKAKPYIHHWCICMGKSVTVLCEHVYQMGKGVCITSLSLLSYHWFVYCIYHIKFIWYQ